MPSSYYFANEIANTYLKNGTPIIPDSLYIGLFISDLNRDGTGTEVTATSYTRKEIKITTPSNGIVNNEESISFGEAQEDWGLVLSYGIFDESIGGNLIFFDKLLFNENVKAGETLTIPALQLQLTIV